MTTNELISYWEKQQPIFEQLYQSVPNYISLIPTLTEAFKLKDRDIRCMDEGAPGGLHIGGSGILLDKERAIEILENMQATGIYSHAGCGAAALYAKQNSLDGDPDEYGKQWAQDLAESAGIQYRGHISAEQMKRPADFHIARAAYYDGSGNFDFSAVPELPPGFIISRKYFDADYAKEELKIAISIALGKHGFGDLITKDNPFLIIVVGNKSDESLSLGALEDEIKGLTSEFNSKVIIDGFTAPA